MKVLFLTLYPELAASSRYRVHQFLPHLAAEGIECDVCSAAPKTLYPYLTGPRRRLPAGVYHLVETPRRLVQLLQTRAYDVVVVQKAILTAYVRGFDRILTALAKRLVLDVDDAVHLAPPHPLRMPWKLATNDNQVKNLMRKADLVLAGNRWLARETETLGGRAIHFPTVVDTERFRPKPNRSETYRIGWIGGPSTTPALGVVRDVLSSFDECDLTLIGADPKVHPIPGAVYKPWSLDSEVSDLQELSVGLMPLAKSEWDRGKCALKAIQYMACGVPCVATPFGAATEIVTDGVNGLFADTPQEWTDALERLRKQSYRQAMGDAGRLLVEERYSLNKAAPKLAEILRSLL